jgi:hypothetical protein
MKRKDRDTYVLSTGREIKAKHGIIGIARAYGESPETFASFEIAEGYNSHLDEIGERDGTNDGAGLKPFTPVERVELADFMIVHWQDVKRHAAAAIGPPRRVVSSALDLERGMVHVSLDCGHETKLQLADPVLAITESYALPKMGDELPCQRCRETPR